MQHEIPTHCKANLTLEEAADYFNIGVSKLREMTNDSRCAYVIWNGNKRLIKRQAFEKYLEASYSI